MQHGRRQRALELALSGASISEIARELRVSRQTVWRWTKTPAFSAELARAREEQAVQLRLRLGALGNAALGALEQIMSEAHGGHRLRAACVVLDRIVPREMRRPRSVDFLLPVSGEAVGSEFEGKTADELELFAKSGRWPAAKRGQCDTLRTRARAVT